MPSYGEQSKTKPEIWADPTTEAITGKASIEKTMKSHAPKMDRKAMKSTMNSTAFIGISTAMPLDLG